MMERQRSCSVSDEGVDVQSPVHRASLRRARRAGRRAARGDRGRRPGRAAEEHRRAAARLAGPRGRRRAGPGRDPLPARRPRIVPGRGHPAEPEPGRRLARPSLVELAASVGEVAGLSVPDGVLVHYVDQVDTPNPGLGPRLDRDAGARCMRCPSGQVFLASLGRRPTSSATSPVRSSDSPDRTLVEPRGPPRARPRDPSRRLRVGPRGVRRGDHLGRRRASPTRPARWSPRSTSTARRTASRSPAPSPRSPREVVLAAARIASGCARTPAGSRRRARRGRRARRRAPRPRRSGSRPRPAHQGSRRGSRRVGSGSGAC